MDAQTSYQLLGKLLVYLELSGASNDRKTFNGALALLADGVAGNEHSVRFEDLLARIPDYFELDESSLPPVAPPIRRSSIGYFTDD